MPRRLNIRTKLVAILSATTLVATGVTSTVGYLMARQTLEQESFRKLTAVREMKASQVEDYFQQIFDQVVTFSEDRMIVDATRRFRSAFAELSAQAALDPAKLAGADLELRLYYQQRRTGSTFKRYRVHHPLPSGAQLFQQTAKIIGMLLFLG